MEDYRDYLPELKSTTLFQEIEDEALIQLLEAMQPPIIERKKGEKPDIKDGFKTFRMVLKADQEMELAPREHKYDMPKFCEPGMLMAEIPSLSQSFGAKPPRKPDDRKGEKGEEKRGDKPDRKGPPARRPLPCDIKMLQFSGEMLTKYYNPEVAEAQGIMLRNLLGILAQKVNDTRKEKMDLIRKLEAEGKLDKKEL